MKMLTSSWMTVLISALIYLGATVAFWKNPVRPLQAAENPTATEAATGPSWTFTNPEADQLISELKAEKKSLQKREQQLADLGVRLDTEKSELGVVTQSVHKMQADFDQSVLRIQEEEIINLKKLAKVYAAMTPDGAATVFAQMDDAPVVKIMAFMKDSETAAIFESLSKKGDTQAKRTAALSERLRLASYRTPKPPS